MAPDRHSVRKGSWRWAVRVAELTAWGTAALLLLLIQVARLPADTRREALVLAALLGTWVYLFFRVLLYKGLDKPWFKWAGVLVMFAFSCGFYAMLRHVPSAQLVFVPSIVGTALMADLPQAIAASLLAVAGYAGIANVTGAGPGIVAGTITSGIYLLSGTVAGSLARELRTHYKAEKLEHDLATAVRHRLWAVLDAVDEAIVFRDRYGSARVVNKRAGDLFGIDPEAHLGTPVVELLRTIARQTEDPEGFMEAFQGLRDDPDAELRLEIEQLTPERRNLRLLSRPTYDDERSIAGRIDVYSDVTENVRRSAEVQRLYEQARRTAESYQRALLPSTAPTLPRMTVVAHYLPAAAGAIRGDFYDFAPLPDGRVALVVGDVCGTGPQAASDAAMTRYTMRSLARTSSDPVKLLTQLNEAVGSQIGSERFVRMFLGVLDPERAILEYVNAGHTEPAVYRARRGSVEWLGEGDLPLGITHDVSYKGTRIELDPGDTVLLYTDGVTEAMRNGRPFGHAKLGDLLSEYGVGTPGELVQALRRALNAWTPGDLHDDVALVVAEVVPDRVLSEPMREIVLPNEPARVPDIRNFVAAFLAEIRAPVDVSSEILLAVGEAAANACRHGRKAESTSEVRVRCALKGTDVTVAVADEGPGFDARALDRADLPDRFASGGRGLYLMRELMDSVAVESSSNGTTITMIRNASRPFVER